MSCDVGEVTESLENEQLVLILQALRHFTYVTAHSPTLPLLYLRHNSFSNPSAASPTSQLIPQPCFRLSYVTGFSLRPPGERPMILISIKFVLFIRNKVHSYTSSMPLRCRAI